jgi:hypothetical protein
VVASRYEESELLYIEGSPIEKVEERYEIVELRQQVKTEVKRKQPIGAKGNEQLSLF